jgi:hypothetical protein
MGDLRAAHSEHDASHHRGMGGSGDDPELGRPHVRYDARLWQIIQPRVDSG